MKVQVIIGSTRPGRISERIAHWVAKEAETLPETQVEIVDLAGYPLPFLDEPISPQYNPDRKPNAEAQKWLDKLAEADAYVIVTPEYNRSISGVLKNALDYIDFQLAQKPVAIVAHGSTGGAQAVANLRMAMPGLKAVTTPTAVFLVGRLGEILDEQGNLVDEDIKEQPYGIHASLGNTLHELKWYSDALAAARKEN